MATGQRNIGMTQPFPFVSRWLRLGVRQKIAIVLITTLVVTLTISTLLSLRSQETQVLEEVHRRGAEVSRLIAQNLGYSVVGYNYTAVEQIVREMSKNEDIAYVRVASRKGNTMAEVGERTDARAGRAMFEQDIRVNNETVGKLYLDLSTRRIVAQLEAQQRESFIRQFLIILLIVTVEFMALSYIIARPLRTIARTLAAGVNSGAAPPSIPIASQDEFGEVVSQFNALHAELAEVHRKLQSRVDFANDELKAANAQLSAQAQGLRRANRELETLSITDPLTGLYNRRHFEKLMETEVALSIRNDETSSIILIDIDNFKQINTEYGHAAGDELLRAVAGAIKSRLRKADDACRYGGDEFFVLCRRATIASAIMVADELREAVSGHVFGSSGIAVTLSMGVATIPGTHPIRTAEEFFRCADLALAECKHRGRDQVIHFCMLDKDSRAFHA